MIDRAQPELTLNKRQKTDPELTEHVPTLCCFISTEQLGVYINGTRNIHLFHMTHPFCFILQTKYQSDLSHSKDTHTGQIISHHPKRVCFSELSMSRNHIPVAFYYAKDPYPACLYKTVHLSVLNSRHDWTHKTTHLVADTPETYSERI